MYLNYNSYSPSFASFLYYYYRRKIPDRGLPRGRPRSANPFPGKCINVFGERTRP